MVKRTDLIIFPNPKAKNLGQYDRPRVHGGKPVDGVLVVLSSNQLNIATFVHKMGDVIIPLMLSN